MEYIIFTDDITQNSFSKYFKFAAPSFLIKKAYLSERYSEAYSKPYQTPKMKRFAKIAESL